VSAASPLPRVAHLLDAPVALRVRRARSLDREDALHQVVVVEDRDLGHFAQALCAEAHDPGVGPHQVGRDAHERTDLADALGPVIVEEIALPVELDGRARQERHERLGDAACPRARTAAGVRRRERLVQVEVAQVEARVARPGDAQDAVRVRLVVAAQPAHVVDRPHELLDARIEDARVLGIGDEQRGGALRDRRPERVEVGVAVRTGVERRDAIPGRPGAGRVRRVREDRGDDLVPLGLAARRVVGPDHGHVGVDRGGACARLERDARPCPRSRAARPPAAR